jgi:hypothetical protein
MNSGEKVISFNNPDNHRVMGRKDDHTAGLDLSPPEANTSKMKLFLHGFLAVCALVSTVQADDFSGKSPSGKLSFESKNERELYIWLTDRPEKKVLVQKNDEIMIQSAAISPDDVWIALEHGGGSLGHTVLFFKRQRGLNFQPFGGGANDPDPSEKVGAYALQTKGVKENILDHSYLHPVRWTDNSMWLIVSLDAKGSFQGKVTRITNWRCRYNPVSHEIQPVKVNPGKIEIDVKPD